MSLLTLPLELLLTITESLTLGDHSSLTLVNHHLSALLQPYLLSRLAKLPLTDPHFALKAIYWSALTNNDTKLKHLLEHAPSISVYDLTRSNRLHLRYNSKRVHTTTTPCSAKTWDWIRSHRFTFGLSGNHRYADRTRHWLGSAAEFGIVMRHRGILRLALSKVTTYTEYLRLLQFCIARQGVSSFRDLLEGVRAGLGRDAWEKAQAEAIKRAVLTRGVRFFVSEKDINVGDEAGRTILHRAVVGLMNGDEEGPFRYSHLELVRALLVKGADVNARDAKGWTPLHVAAAAAFRDVVELLILGGAEVDVVDLEGRTPMHVALRLEHRPEKWGVVAALQEAGADMDRRDNEGVAPRDLMTAVRETRATVRRGTRR